MIPGLKDLNYGQRQVLSVYYNGIVVWARNNFKLIGPTIVDAETGKYTATLNGADVTNSCQWSITTGSQYASINGSGLMTVNSQADSSTVVVSCVYGRFTKTMETIVTYVSGATSDTVVIDNEDGTTTTATTTVLENPDGSTQTTVTAATFDEFGDLIGTQNSETIVNSDGSSSSTTTYYDAEGDPTSTENNTVDTKGNSSTQEIGYDEDGDPVVTGYDIDTSNNPDGYKEFNANGVNTDYYAFDLTHGFILDFNFTIDYAKQPAGQNENHHNILTMKRTNPSPWYGFQLRQTSTTKNIILGTQFSTGGNVNTNLSGATTTGDVEFNLRITYNPTASTDVFVCRDMINDTVVYSNNNGKFPDIEALKYLRVTIGCALDPNGNPYRYSNINVKNFSIKRVNNIEEPSIT